jgi:hypothetical protein
MYEQLRDETPEEVQVFRDLVSAEQWLGEEGEQASRPQ